jgi:hypothetical protein
MADSVEQSKWGKFLGETIIITMVGAVLYFWGRVYCNQLIRSFEFPGALFEISVNDILFSSWPVVVTSVFCASAIASVWHLRHLYLMITWWVLVVVGWLLLLPFRWLPKLKTPSVLKGIFSPIVRVMRWLRRQTPDLLYEKAMGPDDNTPLKCVAAIVIVSLIVAGGYVREHDAKKAFERLSAEPKKRWINVVYQDGKETIGQQVVSLGGNVILDVTNQVGQIDRILVRGSDIKQVRFLPKPAAKEPSISSAPATE